MTKYRKFLYQVLSINLAILILFGFIFSTEAYAQEPIRVVVNGRPLVMDVPPVMRNNRTFVPARFLAKALRSNIQFIPEYNTADVFNENLSITFFLGQDFATIANNRGEMRDIKLDQPAFTVNDRTMFPLRLVAEVFNVSVNWISENRTVEIKSAAPVIPASSGFSLPNNGINVERRRMTPKEVISLIEPATVQIQQFQDSVIGSGFVVAPTGKVITNAHVVRGKENLHVAFKNGWRYPVRLLKISNMSDLALLEIIDNSKQVFPYVRHRARLNTVFSGDTVIAFGNPSGKRWFISHGSVERFPVMHVSSGWLKNHTLIRHNGYTQPGSSGGIVVNLYGEWIGTNALAGVDVQAGFAVPVDYVYDLLSMNYFSLNCDWKSYWAEAFVWKSELERASAYFNRGLDAQNGTQEQIDAWQRVVAITENARGLAQSFNPSFPELHHLPILFVSKTDALLAYYSYIVRNNSAWTQGRRDKLWNAVVKAKTEYDTEFKRVLSIVEVPLEYKDNLR